MLQASSRVSRFDFELPNRFDCREAPYALVACKLPPLYLGFAYSCFVHASCPSQRLLSLGLTRLGGLFVARCVGSPLDREVNQRRLGITGGDRSGAPTALDPLAVPRYRYDSVARYRYERWYRYRYGVPETTPPRSPPVIHIHIKYYFKFAVLRYSIVHVHL